MTPSRRAIACAPLASAFAAALGAAAVATGPTAGPERVAAQPPLRLPICAIQGDGPATMATTATLQTEGIVTAAFVRVEPYGFTIEAPGCDDRPETSDGLFVYVPRDVEADVTVGRRVRVTGRAKEYQGLTELVVGDGAVEDLGAAALPPPAALALPADPAAVEAAVERLEGMRVALPRLRAVAGTDAYGEVTAIDATLPVSHVLRTARDGRLATVIAPSGWPVVTQGDTLDGVVGPLHFSYGEYKVIVDDWSTVTVTPGGRRPAVWAAPDDTALTAATFNVENLFDGIDDPGKDDTEGSYFPRSRAEYEAFVARRARAIADHLRWPDVVSIEEVENLAVLRDLAAHPHLAPGDYGAVLVEGIDPRGIDVGVLYDRRRLRLLGFEQRQRCLPAAEAGPAGLADCALADGGPGRQIFARPPLVVRLALRGTDARFTVIANHFKSKGGDEAETMRTRLLQAQHVLALVEAFEAADPAAPVFVMGDLNEFEDWPPIEALVGSGRLTLLHDRVPAEANYTYIFNGVAQNLDYILVPPAFATAQVVDARPVHINVDFPARPPADREPPLPPFETSRVSDHDPFAMRFRPWGEPRHEAFLPALLRHDAFPSGTGGDAPTAAASRSPSATPSATPSSPAPTGVAPTAAPTPGGPSPTAPAGGVPRTPLRITTLFYDGEVPQTEADEYIEIENVTDAAVPLAGWTVVSVRGTGQVFAFPAAAVMPPRQRCRVYTDEDHPERACSFRWGSDQGLWNNGGDKAELRDPTGALIDHRCYGGTPWGEACGGAPTPTP